MNNVIQKMSLIVAYLEESMIRKWSVIIIFVLELQIWRVLLTIEY